MPTQCTSRTAAPRRPRRLRVTPGVAVRSGYRGDRAFVARVFWCGATTQAAYQPGAAGLKVRTLQSAYNRRAPCARWPAGPGTVSVAVARATEGAGNDLQPGVGVQCASRGQVR